MPLNAWLAVAGITCSVVDLQRIKRLEPATDQVFKLDSPRVTRTLIEAVSAHLDADLSVPRRPQQKAGQCPALVC